MLILLNITAEKQYYSTQIHLTANKLTLNHLAQITLDIVHSQFPQMPNVKIFFYSPGLVEWQFFLSASTVAHEKLVFNEQNPENCLQQAHLKTQSNYRYQQAFEWVNQQGWTDLQYINYQYWAIPPNQYFPIPIPLDEVNKIWAIEPDNTRSVNHDLSRLKKITNIVLIVGNIWFLAIISLRNKLAANPKLLELIKLLMLVYLLVSLAMLILILRKTN